MATSQPTDKSRTITSPPPVSTGTPSSAATRRGKKQPVRKAQYTMIAAGILIVCLVLVGVIWFEIESSPSKAGTASETDIRNPEAATATATEAGTTNSTPTQSTPTQATPMKTTTKKPAVLASRPLLCTFGALTTNAILFPKDGICDLIFFDSAYKEDINVPLKPLTFADSMKTFLAGASRSTSTNFGVAFAYEHIQSLATDLKAEEPTLLDVFWRSSVFHFGIVDMPSSGVTDANISNVFEVLKTLSLVAMERPATFQEPYIVLGAVPQTAVELYASQMRDIYTPTLFISQGHYAFGDNTLPDCRVVPPTMLQMLNNSESYTYGLNDALSALQQIQDTNVSTKWLVSVTMKGRWTTVKENFPVELLSECETDNSEESFGPYSTACASGLYSRNLKYDKKLEAMYTFNAFHRYMLVYDNENSLCKKICQLASNNDSVQFGIAVYDVEYEDYNNNCREVNTYGEYSRLKMVRKMVDYYSSSAGGGSCEDDVPCASGASVTDNFE